MDNTLSMGRRVLSAVVATFTILWAAGAAAFVVPQTANAAEAGDLIRGTSFSTVYFYGYDGSRYIFPNEKTYDTWFNGFSGVEMLSDAAVAAIPPAGNVVYRPGSRWIKIDTAAETYAVGRDGMIHWVETEEVATGLAGSDWNQNIDDVPDAFFDNYTEGVSLTEAEVWDGALYMEDGEYYVSWDGNAHMLTSAARSANDLEDRFFLDGADIDASALDAGDDFTGFVCDLSDASQSGMCEDEPVVVVGGDLMVSLASTTPASALVPDAASRVTATTWKFTADDATELAGLTVTYNGLADEDVIADNGVYLYEGAERLANGKDLNASTKTATFASLDLDFAAGETKYISVVVDMVDADGVAPNSTLEGTFRFGLANADAVNTDGTASGSFPLWGNTHEVIDTAVAGLEVTPAGSVPTVQTLGSSDATIARFELESPDEDIEVNAIGLTVEGDAKASEHSDYALYQGGDMVAEGEFLRDDLVLFVFDEPFLLEDGDSRIFEARATIGGEKDDTIVVFIESAADVDATDLDTGFGAAVDVTAYDTEGEGTEITIEGGSITLAFNGPQANDVRNTAQNHEFFSFTMTAEEYTEVNELTFTVDGDDLFDDNAVTGDPDQPNALEDIRLVNADTGSLIGSLELSGADDDDQELTFDDEFTLNAGDTITLAITADLNEDVVEEGDTFIFDLRKAGQTGAAWQFEDGDDAITDVIPDGGLTGKVQTAVASGLTVDMANTPNGEVTIVRGTEDVEVAAFTFDAADGEDINVTSITVTADDGDADPRTFISSCVLYDATSDEYVGTLESPDANGEMLFNGFTWTLEGGEEYVLSVMCDFSDVEAAGEEFFFSILANDVTASEATGGSVDVAGLPQNDTGADVTIIVNDAGTLDVTVAAGSRPAAQLVQAGTTVMTSAFRFDATREDFTVEKLTIEDAANATESPISSVTLMWGEDGEATATMSGNEAEFDSLGLEIGANDSVTVEVWATISDLRDPRGTGFADSNDFIDLEIVTDDGDDDTFEARGQSGVLDTTVAATTTSRTHVVRETIPELSAGTVDSTFLDNGEAEVFTFTVNPGTEGVSMDQVLFALSGDEDVLDCDTDTATAIADTDFRLERGTEDISDNVTFTLHTSDLSECDTNPGDAAYLRVVFDAEAGEEIDSSITYSLYADLDGTSGGDKSIAVSIPRESTVPTATLTGSDVTVADTTTKDLTVVDSSNFGVGMVIVGGDEQMLVTEIVDGTTITVVRGYAGTTPETQTNVEVDFKPSVFLWQDDGTTTLEADHDTEEVFWGGYLVDNLPASGPSIWN